MNESSYASFFWNEKTCGCNSNERPNLFGSLFLLSNYIFVVKILAQDWSGMTP